MVSESYQEEKAQEATGAGLHNQVRQVYPYIVGELHQKREYLIRQLMDVQNAIDAVIRAGF